MVKVWTNTKELLDGKQLRFYFEPEFELLTTFLVDDVGDTPESFLESLEEVIDGTVDYVEMSGNICTLEISPEQTRVYAHSEKNSDIERHNCIIETTELKWLLKVWAREFEKFNRK